MATEEKASYAVKGSTSRQDGNSTIFDDVFKTIVEKFPWLLVPMINEIFGTDYAESDLVEEEKTEYQTPKGRRMVDSHIKIRDKVYHMECQSTEDNFMAIRMVEYDFHLSLDGARQSLWQAIKGNKGERLVLRFPSSCVLYLRHGVSMPDELEMDIEIPGNLPVRYVVSVVKTQKYTKDEIFRKKLLMLLPFYILRYEEQIKSGKNEFLDAWTEEYKGILDQIRAVQENDRDGMYEQLIELIRRIAKYLGEKEKNKDFMERMEKLMGGQVLELETGKAWEKGKREGEREGTNRINQLNQRLCDNGRTDDLIRSTRDESFQKKLLKEYGL